MDEMLERIALELGVALWDGRQPVPLVHVADVTAMVTGADIWRQRTALGRMLARMVSG